MGDADDGRRIVAAVAPGGAAAVWRGDAAEGPEAGVR
jgi:hypothetical protein